MPHVEIKCSGDLKINFDELFYAIESTINHFDKSSGECKSRAYPTDIFKYSHILVTISMLAKPYRDETFTKSLSRALESEIKKHLKQDCFFSFLIEYNLTHYVTNQHVAS